MRVTGPASTCGPAALSALLGITTIDAATRIRAARERIGKRRAPRHGRVAGATIEELDRVLQMYDRQLERRGHCGLPVGPFVASTRDRADTFLVATATHFLVARRGRAVDNNTRALRAPSTLWCARRAITSLWRVIPSTNGGQRGSV